MDDIFKVINDLENSRFEMNISRDSIEFVSVICRALKPGKVLEIGTFNGYSALWLSLYSGKVMSLEVNPEAVDIARENIKKSGCKNVEIISGDAVETLKILKEKFDVILIDARKSEYKKYLELSLKLLKNNGLIFVDNTISHGELLGEFFDFLNRSSLYYKELNLGKGLMVIASLH